jgi:RimJ/RimL family protein N-acetyltransferase
VAREERYLAIFRAFPVEEVRKFVTGQKPQFGAFVGEELVGWCDIIPKPLPAFSHIGMLGMGVASSHRGRGIGSALMRATLDDARASGLTRIELTVRTDNERAKRLYEKFGFVGEGLCRRHMRVRGEYYDSHLMALLFD